MQISIVIPLYNEDESLPELTAWIDKVLKENNLSAEIIMVDDGSKDRSWEVIKELQKTFPYLHGIRFSRNYGKSAALHVGFEKAQGDVVITMDADMQDSPDEIPALYKMIAEEGYDLVSGYKQKRYDPLSKTIPTKLFNFATRKMSGINNLHDFNCGLKAYKKDVVKNIEVWGEMHRYIPVLAKWEGFEKIEEKVVQHRERKYGVTKFGLNRFVNGFLDLLTLMVMHKYFKKPMHFFGVWGLTFALLGGGMLGYLAFVRTFFSVWLSDRIPALFFGTVSFLLGMLFFCTGLLGEMMSRNSPYKNQYKVREEI
jgi:glycosyltransferase involved in cell wall biosynthesis